MSDSIDIYVDGSCLSNQSPDERRAGAGYVVVRDGERVTERSEHVGDGSGVTNNRAEYEAVLAGLAWRDANAPDEPVTIHTDSDLVVKQVTGTWTVRSDNLIEKYMEVRDAMGSDDDIVVAEETPHVSRAHDLAQAGAADVDVDDTDGASGSGSTTSSGSRGGGIPRDHEPEIVDGGVGNVNSPHSGIDPSRLPDGMKRRVQWICWAAEETTNAQGETYETKVPRDPKRSWLRASWTDPDVYEDFTTALSAVGTNGVLGVGYVVHPNDPYVALDFDGVRDPDTGEIDDWAQGVLDSLDSYAYVSVSNTGVHAYVEADGVPSGWTNKNEDQGYDRELEVYGADRFLAVTGHKLPDVPSTIRSHSDFDEWLLGIQSEVWGE